MLKVILILAPIGGVLLLFIRLWTRSLEEKVKEKVNRDTYDLQITTFKEALDEMNGEVKESFDKLIERFDEQRKDTTEFKVEMAKLTQRVDDLIKNGIKERAG